MPEEGESISDGEIDYLLKAIRAFRPGASLREALDTVVKAVREALGFEACMLSLVEKDVGGLNVVRRVAAAGIPDNVFRNMASKTTPVDVWEAVMDEKFRISSSYFIPHKDKSAWTDKLLVHIRELPAPSEEGGWHPEDMLLVPLRVFDGTLIGLLSVDSPTNGKVPGLRVIQLLEIFASYATINIENIRLLESAKLELERRSVELGTTVDAERQLTGQVQAILDIDTALLNTSLDTEEVFGILLDKSRALTSADTSSVLVMADGEQSLRIERSSDKGLVGLSVPMFASVCGWVARHDQPHIVRDAGSDSLYHKISAADPDRSEIAVPLRLDSKVIGVLNLQARQQNAFREEHTKVLQLLADRAALALRNAAYFYEQEAVRHIDKLILNIIEDLGQTLSVILGESLKLVHAHHGNLMLLEGDCLVIRATTGNEPLGTELSLHNSVSGMAVAERFAVNIPDVDKEPMYQRVLTDEYMRSELAVPLLDGDQVIGVLNVESPHLKAFGVQEENLLMLLAGQAAVAIRVARHNKEMEALRKIDRAILTSSHDLGKVLNVILEESLQIIDARHGNLLLLEGGRLLVKATTGTEQIGTEIPINDSVSGIPIIERRTVYVKDTEKDPKYKRVLTEEYMRSEIVVPLIQDDQVIGVLNVESPKVAGFSLQDERLLQVVAGQAAIAINQGKLIEQIKNAQEKLIMTESIRAIGATTSQLTHWIANRTTPILGCVERVENKVDDDSILEDLEMIRENANLIMRIKEDMLGPARDLHFQPVMIGDLIKDILSGMHIPRNVKVISRIAEGLPLVNLDPEQFGIVLDNLVKNAVESFESSTKDTGQIEISAVLEREQPVVRVEVTDNGPGIPAEILQKIWLPFFTTKGKKGGTGLGLNAAQQIVQRMGAEISLASSVGVGTTFTIRVPVTSLQK